MPSFISIGSAVSAPQGSNSPFPIGLENGCYVPCDINRCLLCWHCSDQQQSYRSRQTGYSAATSAAGGGGSGTGGSAMSTADSVAYSSQSASSTSYSHTANISSSAGTHHLSSVHCRFSMHCHLLSALYVGADDITITSSWCGYVSVCVRLVQNATLVCDYFKLISDFKSQWTSKFVIESVRKEPWKVLEKLLIYFLVYLWEPWVCPQAA